MDFSLDGILDISNQIQTAIKRFRFGKKQQLAFLEDMYLLVNDGIPANRAIEMMGKVTTGVSKDVAESLTEKIGEGQPLAEGMEEWFSPNIVEIIRVGESGGALAQTVQSAIKSLSQSGAAIGGLVSALTYPLVVITIACCVIIYLNTSVFDQFRAIKPQEQWPAEGQRLVAVAEFIKTWWWVVLVSVVIFILVMLRIFSHYAGTLRPFLDKYPPFSLYKKMVAARILETLGLLVSNGVVFKSAIQVMQLQATPYALSHLTMMEHLLSMGKTNIADVLNTGLVGDEELLRLRVMAEVKGFEHGLVRMGVRGAEQASETMNKIAKILGGMMLAVGGVLIIIILQGIFMTGMSMGS